MISSTKDSSIFWRKKEYISFLLSILVVCTHSSSFLHYASSGGFISVINENVCFFFKWTLVRFAVPMFFMLSGISFFRGYDHTKYRRKMKSRFYSLVIPYLLWNTIWMLFDIICSHSFISKFYIGRQVFDPTLKNILWGIFFYKSNGPFWYIFDLIVFSLAAPLIYEIVRRKYVGLASVTALTILTLFGVKLPESVFFSSTSIIFYMTGAIIGLHYFDAAAAKTSKGIQCCSVVFLSAYVIFKMVLKPEPHPQQDFIDAIVYTLCAVSAWSIADIIVPKAKPRKIYSRSFAIYAMHVNVLAVFIKLLYLALPKQEWMAIPNFVFSVALTVIAIHLACTLLEKYLPAVYAALMGHKGTRRYNI